MSRQILVIDDECTIRIIVQMALEATEKWQVASAATALEGLQMAQHQQPDAILLDVMMPEQNGYDLLKLLQADPLTQEIPVIFFTAKTREAKNQNLAELGLAGVIVKPFEPKLLARQIKALLGWVND